VLQGLLEERLHLGARCLRLQQRVVDQGGQIRGTFLGGDLAEGPVVQAPRVAEEAMTFHAAQELGHAFPWKAWYPGADFSREVEEGIDHGSIMAAGVASGKTGMKKRAEARFS